MATKVRTESPEKKERLLDAAQRLMLGKGFVATTVDEICKAAGVTKGSFFYYFKSKEALGEELVERFGAVTAEFMAEGACCGGDDPLDRVYGCIDIVIKMSKNPAAKGCLIGTFAQEVSESHPRLRCLCAKSFSSGIETFKKDLAAAKTKYAPKASFDVTGLAESFSAMIQGALILMKANRDRNIMERTLTHYKGYLKTIFGR